MPGIELPTFPRSGLNREQAAWQRAVEDSIKKLWVDSERNGQSGDNANSSQNSTMSRLASTVRALPVVSVGQDTQTGFNLTAGGWLTRATVVIPVPDGKTLANVVAIGGAAAVDLTSGGVTVCQARILLPSLVSPFFQAAKDAGASAVNNILTANYGAEIAVTPGSTLTANLQLNPLNASAFGTSAGNYATLTVIAVFTNPS